MYSQLWVCVSVQECHMVRRRCPNGSYGGFRIEQRGFDYLAVRGCVALLIYVSLVLCYFAVLPFCVTSLH